MIETVQLDLRDFEDVDFYDGAFEWMFDNRPPGVMAELGGLEFGDTGLHALYFEVGGKQVILATATDKDRLKQVGERIALTFAEYGLVHSIRRRPEGQPS